MRCTTTSSLASAGSSSTPVNTERLVIARACSADGLWLSQTHMGVTGDCRTGEGAGTDEEIRIQLQRLPKQVARSELTVLLHICAFSFADWAACNTRSSPCVRSLPLVFRGPLR